ncbi:hypothetical protein D3C76_1341980 [compost metagenome]
MCDRKLQQQPFEKSFPQRDRHRHAHRPGHFILQSGQCLPGSFYLQHQRLGLGQERSACCCQAQAARGSMQQQHSVVGFQLADALGQLALAPTQLLGGQGEAARFDQHCEGGQIVQFAH